MIIKDSRESLEQKAAWLITDIIQELLEEQEKVVLALPGGRSVAAIFEHLRHENIEWEKVHVFMVDERMVPITDNESNYLLVKEHLLTQGIPAENVHPFDYENPRKYVDELAELGGKFDVFLVSSGEDGHVAGLYPNHHSINDEGVFITMDDSPKPPPHRMSSSRALLEKSQAAILVFFGESKREAFRMFSKDGSVEECPARLVKSLPRWYCLTDQGVA